MKINYSWFTQKPNERYHCALFLHYLSLFLRSLLSVPLMALISNSPLFQPLSHYCSLPWHYVEQGWGRRKRVNLCIGRRGKKVSCGQINKADEHKQKTNMPCRDIWNIRPCFPVCLPQVFSPFAMKMYYAAPIFGGVFVFFAFLSNWLWPHCF